jgi:hypothetical protein
MRCKALEQLTRSPDLSVNLSGSEQRLLQGTSKPSLISCLVARELRSRERDLEDMSEDRARVAREADRFTALNESFVKSVSLVIFRSWQSAIRTPQSAISSPSA